MAKGFNRILQKGIITDKKERMEVLEVEIENMTKDISFAAFITDGIESIDTDTLKVMIPKLDKKIVEWKKLKKELEDLE